MTYSTEQLNKMLLPQVKSIAKAIGIKITNVKKTDLISLIIDKQNEEDLFKKSKKILKKHIKSNIGNETVSVKSAIEFLSTQLSESEKKEIEQMKVELKSYIKKIWNKYEQLEEKEPVIDQQKSDLVTQLKEPVVNHQKSDFNKYTVAQLKEKMKEIGINEPLKGRLKEELIRYAQSDRCYPSNGVFCKEGEVCDIRNNLCVLEGDIPSKKDLKKYEHNGYVVVGTDAQLDEIRAKSSGGKDPLDSVNEDSVTNLIITFIQNSTGRVTNVQLFNKIKEAFNLDVDISKIQVKFDSFLKTLYKEVKSKKIGYSCKNGVCALTRDVSSIEYPTIEQCKDECKKESTVECKENKCVKNEAGYSTETDERNYFACKENKCVIVPLDEAEYKTQSDCEDECYNKKKVKLSTQDNRVMVLNDQKIILDDFKDLDSPALVNEVNRLLYPGIFYDEDVNQQKLKLMKCMGLILF